MTFGWVNCQSPSSPSLFSITLKNCSESEGGLFGSYLTLDGSVSCGRSYSTMFRTCRSLTISTRLRRNFFQQLRDVVPSGRLQAPLLYFNLGVAYCTFLLVLLLVNHYYSYLLRWVPGGAILFLDGLRPSRRSAWYAATMFLLRILSGATHALLPYSPIAKLAILLGLQLAMFLLASAHFR